MKKPGAKLPRAYYGKDKNYYANHAPYPFMPFRTLPGHTSPHLTSPNKALPISLTKPD